MQRQHKNYAVLAVVEEALHPRLAALVVLAAHLVVVVVEVAGALQQVVSVVLVQEGKFGYGHGEHEN